MENETKHLQVYGFIYQPPKQLQLNTLSVWYPLTGYAIKRLENIQIGVA